MKTSRILYIFLLTNFLFWAFGLVVICYTLWLVVAKPLAGTEVMAFLFMTMGIVTFMTGFIGCCGGTRINLMSLKVYVVVTIAFYVLELIAFIYIGVVGGGQLFDEDGFLQYWMDLPVSTRASLQNEYECCGVNSFNDYLVTDTAPDLGCYSTETISGIIYYTAHDTGCSKYVKSPLEVATQVNLAIIVGVCIIQGVGLFADYKLIQRIKRQRDRQAILEKAKAEKLEKKRKARERSEKRRARKVDDEKSLLGESPPLPNADEHDRVSERSDEQSLAASPEPEAGSTASLRGPEVHSPLPGVETPEVGSEQRIPSTTQSSPHISHTKL